MLLKHYKNFSLIYGNSHPKLAEEVAKILKATNQSFNVASRFADGEVKIKLPENIRGKKVYILQSTNPPAENLIELFLMIDAARRAAAQEITIIMPYAGYSRQERKDEPRVPISFAAFMEILEFLGTTRIVCYDLHAAASQGFVKIPFDNLFFPPYLLREFIEKGWFNQPNDVCFVADLGYAKIAQVYADLFKCELVIARKKRKSPDELEEKIILVGEIKPKVIFIDDIASTLRTANQIGKACIDKGAKELGVAIVHPIFSESPDPQKNFLNNLENSPFSYFVFGETVFISEEKKKQINEILNKNNKRKIEFVSPASLIAWTIKEIHENGSLSQIFEKNKEYLINLKKQKEIKNE